MSDDDDIFSIPDDDEVPVIATGRNQSASIRRPSPIRSPSPEDAPTGLLVPRDDSEGGPPPLILKPPRPPPTFVDLTADDDNPQWVRLMPRIVVREVTERLSVVDPNTGCVIKSVATTSTVATPRILVETSQTPSAGTSRTPVATGDDD